MTPALIPLLVLSLLLMAADGENDAVQLLLAGEHRLDAVDEPVIVGDATVTVSGPTRVTAPIYLIGGTTRIDGDVRSRVTQLAGTLVVGDDARIAELRHIGGATVVSADGRIARRTSPVTTPGADGGAASVLPFVIGAALLALMAALLARTHGRNLDVIADAATGHPVVAVTVGLLLTLTALSLFVFMAFTLVLIPVSLLGLGAGLLVVLLGVIACGRLLARRLPVGRPAAATGLGAAAVLGLLSLVGRIPVVGDLVVGVVLLGGVGAVVITYLGYGPFRPEPLPD